jgi:hypothetical protein
MAIVWVQNAAIGSTSAGTSQATSAFPASPTVGNYVVWTGWGWNSGSPGQTNATITATDSATGNTWIKPANVFQKRATDLWCSGGYAKIANTTASFTVTVTDSSGSGNGAIMICAAEFSGVAASSPEDGTGVGANGSSVTVAPGSKSITSGSLVVLVAADDNTTFTGSTPTGYTRVGFQNNGSTFEVGEGAYAINPSSPTNPSRTITTNPWVAGLFALLAAGTSDTLFAQAIF